MASVVKVSISCEYDVPFVNLNDDRSGMQSGSSAARMDVQSDSDLGEETQHAAVGVVQYMLMSMLITIIDCRTTNILDSCYRLQAD